MSKGFFFEIIKITKPSTRGGIDVQYHSLNRNCNRNRIIDAAQAKKMMQENPDAIILDVRTAREFSIGHVSGAVSLPEYALAERAKMMIPNKDTLVLVYCRSGARSRMAMYDLLSMGFTNVYDFGGIVNWPYERT
ncbi:MAG: rhodanese-like domain-containing protein [Defluviitaleaceae bacterium]|nr:rhodanese-like domain-containing protein [Defluviitaleaceae bacterium]